MERMRRLLVAAIALGATATATTAGVTVAADAGTTLDWKPCGAVSCATMAVPLDRDRPRGATVTIVVARHEATDAAHRIGTLYFSTGAGGSPVDMLAQRYPYFPAQLRERFDLVAVGPRGFPHTSVAGASTLDCATPAQPSLFPRTPEQYAALVKSNRDLYASCRARSGTLVDHVDADSQARDWEAVRVALDERRITVLTLLQAGLVAQRYARLFPDKVRAMVLDGPSNTTTPFPEAARLGARTGEETLTHFAAWCAANPPVPDPPPIGSSPTSGCSLHGQDAKAVYRQIEDTAPDTPADASRLLSYFLVNGDYAGGGWVDLGATLYAAQHGDYVGLTAMYNASLGQAGRAYEHASVCANQPQPTYDELMAAVRPARATATRGESGPWEHAAGCTGWPVTPRPVERARTSAPVLVVPTRTNLHAPYAMSIGVAEQFRSATTLVNEDDGHIAWLQSPQLQQQVDDFLIGPV
jgi:pimeloyl-ACP methyl ester carboxylesterase